MFARASEQASPDRQPVALRGGAMGRSTRKALVGLSIWTVVIAGAAQASEVYQGNDVSYGKDANRKLVVCDHEADSRGGRHRTVEEINNWPDAKSGWSYH